MSEEVRVLWQPFPYTGVCVGGPIDGQMRSYPNPIMVVDTCVNALGAEVVIHDYVWDKREYWLYRGKISGADREESGK